MAGHHERAVAAASLSVDRLRAAGGADAGVSSAARPPAELLLLGRRGHLRRDLLAPSHAAALASARGWLSPSVLRPAARLDADMGTQRDGDARPVSDLRPGGDSRRLLGRIRRVRSVHGELLRDPRRRAAVPHQLCAGNADVLTGPAGVSGGGGVVRARLRPRTPSLPARVRRVADGGSLHPQLGAVLGADVLDELFGPRPDHSDRARPAVARRSPGVRERCRALSAMASPRSPTRPRTPVPRGQARRPCGRSRRAPTFSPAVGGHRSRCCWPPDLACSPPPPALVRRGRRGRWPRSCWRSASARW